MENHYFCKYFKFIRNETTENHKINNQPRE